jgi:uncharacterized repeat protein (TIGR03803 family)
VLYNFQGASKGAFPSAGVVFGPQGDLFGTSQGGDISTDFGTIFRMSTKGKNEKDLHVFASSPDGCFPQAELVPVGNGTFYGTAAACADGAGAVFKITANGKFDVVYSFLGGVDGANPSARLITDNNGDFLGTTYNGGAHTWGTVFRVTAAGKQKVLYSITGGADGRNPATALATDSVGDIYGTTYFGGGADAGVVFKLKPNGKEVVLHSFKRLDDGANPLGNLLIDDQDNVYGTANQGGNTGNGTVFRISQTGDFKVLYRFNGNLNGGADGANPTGDLYRDAAGALYGTTESGGEHASGTVFKLTL